MKLDRPLVVLDLETTGTNVQTDRIVDIALVTLHPDGRRESWASLVNPGVPIPKDASEVHGITDTMVAEAPTFREVASEVAERIGDADIGGFNVRRFDLPLLRAEFERIGKVFAPLGRVVDAQEVYHHHFRRDLSAASRQYLGVEHVGAHRAESDAAVTLEILRMQAGFHSLTVEQMAVIFRPPNAVDADGKLVWREGYACFTFGKHNGHSLQWTAKHDPSWLAWVQRSDFSQEVKRLCCDALERKFPEAPDAS